MQTNVVNRTAASVSPSDAKTRYLPALLAALAGLSLLFIAGFAETGVLHNAAHDSRHSAAFPCH